MTEAKSIDPLHQAVIDQQSARGEGPVDEKVRSALLAGDEPAPKRRKGGGRTARPDTRTALLRAAQIKLRNSEGQSLKQFGSSEKLGPSSRPLIGADVSAFFSDRAINSRAAVYALGLVNQYGYARLLSEEANQILKFPMEFMIRLCMEHPTIPPWTSRPMLETFGIIYGPVLDQFRDSGHEEMARVMLYIRMTGLLGRSSFSAYRWLERGSKASPLVQLILSKIVEHDEPRLVAESISETVWRLRGVDFNRAFPLPTLDMLSKMKHIGGRLPRGGIERTRAVMGGQGKRF